MRLITLITALSTALLASAARLIISIPPSPPHLPNPSTLPSSTHAVLLGPPGVRYDAPIRRDNTFLFPSLEPGSYLLTVHSRDHFFPPLRLDVSSNQTLSAWQTFRGNEWSNKGSLYGTAQDALSIEVRPSGVKEFYQERMGFSVVSFLKSPMILMALVSVGMIFGLPYLMDNSESLIACEAELYGMGEGGCVADMCTVDPETKKEFEEMQAKGPISGSNGAASQSMCILHCHMAMKRLVLTWLQYKTSISRAGWLERAQEQVVDHQVVEVEAEAEAKENDCIQLCMNIQRHLGFRFHTLPSWTPKTLCC